MHNSADNHRTNARAQQIQNAMQEIEKPRVRLSRDINKAMQEVMVIIDNLQTFLIKETNALKDTDTPLFLTMQDEKLEVSREYLEGLSQIMGRKEELVTADESLKMRLEEMRNQFAEIAADNHASINRMRNGMERLSQRIMEAARETARKEQQIIYGAGGRMQSANRGTIGVSESA